MSEAVAIQKVKIDPIGCYRQAFELVQGEYWVLLAVSAVAMFIGGSIPVVLIGPMTCGVYMCFLKKYRGDEFEFELLFKGFDLFLPSLIASVIMTGVALVILVPAVFVAFAGMLVSISAAEAEGGQAAAAVLAPLGCMFGFLLLLMFAAILLVGMLFTFTFPLIVDRNLTGTAAVVASARAAVKNFWGVLGLVALNTLLGLAGALACYVGTFFVLPISFAALTIAYRKVFPEIAATADPAADGTLSPGAPGAAALPA